MSPAQSVSRAELKTLLEELSPIAHRNGQWYRWEKALLLLERLVEDGEEDPAHLLPRIWMELGIVYREQARIEEAEPHLQRAVSGFGEIGEFINQGGALVELGRVYEARGMPEPAYEVYQRAAATAARHKDDALRRQAIKRLASQALADNETEEALAYLNQIAETLSEDEDPDPETLLLRGRAYLAKGDFQTALNNLREAHSGFIAENNLPYVARAHFQIALAAYQAGDSSECIDHLQRGQSLMRQLGDFVGLSRLITAMGIIRLEEGFVNDALTVWDVALQVQADIGDTRGEAFTRFHLADLKWKLGDLEDARQNLSQAQRLADQYGIDVLINEIARHPLHAVGGGRYNDGD